MSVRSRRTAAQFEQRPSRMIKVMSLNLRYGLAEDGDNHWDLRKEFASARIRAFDPDLLGLQECRDDAQASFVRSNLPEYHFSGVPRGGDGDTALEMAPLLVRKSTFQIIQGGCFWLSETPQVAGSKSWDSTFARTATWAELVHRLSGRSMVFLNTHFDYQPMAVVESARLLQQWVSQTVETRPLVVTGDFNAEKRSAAYQHLTTGAGLLDAYRQVYPDGADEATFHGFGQPGRLAPIDWILVSNHFCVVDAAVDRSRQGNLFPSDHYPLTAVLNWKGGNS